MRVLRGHSDDVRSVAFSRDGKWVVSGSDDHLVKIWDVATGAEVRSFEGVRFDSLKPQNLGWRCTVFLRAFCSSVLPGRSRRARQARLDQCSVLKDVSVRNLAPGKDS